jgi:3-hydroxybutyryl-CoA dehydrogenase
MNIKTIGVVGAGQMGGGIAQVAATSGFNVVLMDVNQAQIDKSLALMKKLLEKNVAKDRITEDEKNATLARISSTTEMSGLANVDFAVEAATENIDLKLKIFKTLDEATKKDIILATNTSSISITKIAAVTSRPEKVIGMHFMNPVPVMKLVEIIKGLATSEETLNTTLELAKAMGKTTTNSEDIPGFIANRILMPYINEAVQTLFEGIGTVEDIDTTMKLGTNVPMGPLTLADFIGLDTCLAIMQVLHDGLGDSKYRPSPLLVKYVEAGWLGRKSGRGFYRYN